MYTLLSIRQNLAQSCNSLVQGTATVGSTTMLVDTNLLDSGQYADDHFIGGTLYITGTADGLAPKGQGRYITDFVASSGTLTVGNPFSASIDPGDEYDIYLRFSLAELNNAILFAVDDTRLYSSLSLDPNVTEYTLNVPGLHHARQVQGVWVKDTASTDATYVQLNEYRIWDNAGTITLELGEDVDSTYTVRIEYIAKYDAVSGGTFGAAFDDTAVMGGDLWDHILAAQSYLYRMKMQDASSPDREWFASLYRETYERLTREKPKKRRRAGKVKGIVDWDERIGEHKYQPDWW